MSIFILIVSLNQMIFSTEWHYPDSYQTSRAHFLEVSSEVSKNFKGSELFSRPVKTRTSAELFIDGLFIPQQSSKPQRLLIITSGVHGIEAFTGSAIQDYFLHSVYSKEIGQDVGILILHGINPYGFYFKRRVTEANVDLNRNLSGDQTLFTKENDDYAQFSSLLNPTKPLSAHWYDDLKLFVRSITKLATHGKKAMTQIVVGGQYQDPKGVYFGGQSLEENSLLVRELFKKYGTGYQQILHLDLHTGYGARGELHFFSTQQTAGQPGFDRLFQGFHIDLSSDKDFYKTSGSFDNLTTQVFHDREVIPMTLEFGTMDSQTILGGFLSLKNMIYENQAFHYGHTDTFSKDKSNHDFSEMFNPSAPDWRSQVLTKSKAVLPILVERFSKIELQD